MTFLHTAHKHDRNNFQCLQQFANSGHTTWWSRALFAQFFHLSSAPAAFLYYLTPSMSRILLQKLTVPQLVNKFPALRETRRFITAFTTARHVSIPCARSIQSNLSQQTLWRSISDYLHLDLPGCHFAGRDENKEYWSVDQWSYSTPRHISTQAASPFKTPC